MAEDLDNDDKWLYGESNDALGAENENVPEHNDENAEEPQALEELQQTQVLLPIADFLGYVIVHWVSTLLYI